MKRKMMTRFSAGCLALLLTVGSVCSVQAAQETQTGQSPEQTVQTGSVTVQLTPGKEGTSVADVEFSLTKVGKIQDSTYVLLPEYESTKIDLNTLTTASSFWKVQQRSWQRPPNRSRVKKRMEPDRWCLKTGAGSVSF